MNSQTTYNQLEAISEKDYALLCDMVLANPDACVNELRSSIFRLFGTSITPGHYMTLGFLIGHRLATVEANHKLNHITNLCQRQN
jgi:hypothetical protein